MKKLFKNTKGITLIALVITIVILLILAAVAIGQVTGNGLFNNSKKAQEEYSKSKILEDVNMLILDYNGEKVLSGITLEDYLIKNNEYYEVEDGKIKLVEGDYITTIDPITLEISGPTKTNKAVKINLNKKTLRENETLIVTLVLGEEVDVSNCKYKFEKASVTVVEDDVTTPVTNMTISDLPTDTKGKYYFYLLVAYKDGSENVLKKTQVNIGIPVTGVTLNKTNINLFAGDTENLTVNVLPSNAIQEVVWTCEPTSVATVNQQGVVTAVSGGTATVTVASTDDTTKTATCTVVVETLDSIAITTPPTKVEYDEGDILDLTGMTVTATYKSGKTRNITSLITPTNLTTVGNDISATISYTEGSITKTATTSVTVIAVYTWTKYSATPGKVWDYHKTQSDISFTTYSYSGQYYPVLSSLENTFNVSNGKFVSDRSITASNMKNGMILLGGDNTGYVRTPIDYYYDPDAAKGLSYNYAYVSKSASYNSYSGYFSGTADLYEPYQKNSYKQGTTNYGTVKNRNENAYPENGYQEDDGTVYWYVKNNS